jgi:hypothetical protein
MQNPGSDAGVFVWGLYPVQIVMATTLSLRM